MPGIRLFDVRAALAALGLAMLAALAVAVVTHLPVPAASGPATQTRGDGLSRLQSLPLQAQSVISSTIAADNQGFAARRTAAGWGLSGGGVRADFHAGQATLTAGGSTVSLSLIGVAGARSVTARGNRVTLSRPGIREWYAAGPLGIEQGFTLAHRPATTTGDLLTLSLAVGGMLHARTAGPDVELVRSRNDIVARYGGLSAVDARGRHLAGTLTVSHGRVLLTVNDRGARYPITIDPLLQQGLKLVPHDIQPGGSGSQFGDAVAISNDGNTALIGAQIDNGGKGAAWVFTRSNGTWTQLGLKLIAPVSEEPGDSDFGASVALSADGSTALIGGDLDSSQTGAAWVFVRSGSTYIDQKKLTPNGATGSSVLFGHSVALSANGNTALIGGPDDQGLGGAGNSGGAVWVFTRSGTSWGTGTKISPTTGPANNNSSHFGTAVALSPDGTIALTGGPGDGPGTGAVWEYTGSGSTWTPVQRLVPNDEASPSGFGSSIAISGDSNTAVIGDVNDNNSTGGAAWVFTRSGTTWSQQGQKLVPSNASGPNAQIGSAVAISGDGNTILIGASNDSNMIGAAWLYTRSAGVWTQQQRLSGSGETGFGMFASGVALSSDGQTAMIGASSDDNKGAAFAFAPPPPICNSVSATGPQGGGSLAVSLSCTLPFGAHPSYSILGGPSNGTVSGFNPSTGQLTYTSAAFFSGQDSLTYRVSDQWGISNIATATLITPFLPVPRCSNVTARGKRGATRVTIKLKCTGPAGHPFSYGIVSKPGNGRLSKIKHGKVTYTTHVGFSGSDRFVYNATDSGGSSRAATATIVLPKLGRITSTMTWPQDFGAGAASTVIPDMIVKNLPGGAMVKLSCSKGCPIKARTFTLAKHRVCKGKGRKRKCKMAAPKTGNLDLGRYVAHRRVKVGGQITVAMIQAGSIGKEYVFRMVKNNQPTVKIQTLAPGSTKLCPSC
jgi:hypothetical protein